MSRQAIGIGEFGKISTRAVSKGVVEARCRYGDIDGVTRSVTARGKSADDARRNLVDALDERSARTGQVIDGDTTLDVVFEHWIGTRTDLEPQTIKTYRSVWRLHGRSALGKIKVARVRTSIIKGHVLKLSPSQGRDLLKVLVQVLDEARMNDAVTTNAAKDVKPVRKRRTGDDDVRAMSLGQWVEVRKLLVDYSTVRRTRGGPLPGKLLVPVADVLVGTGCRIGEAFALDWADVDFARGRVTIRATIVGTGAKTDPLRIQPYRKNQGKAITVTVPNWCLETLKRQHGETGPSGLVFRARNDGIVSYRNWATDLRQALAGTGYEWVHPHTFRKSVATWIAEVGGDAAAARQLGHQRETTTTAHYIERPTMVNNRALLERFR